MAFAGLWDGVFGSDTSVSGWLKREGKDEVP